MAAPTSSGRVAVQLMPLQPDAKFVMALRACSKNPKLRIDNVRRSKDVSMVIEHCQRRWKEHLDEFGDEAVLVLSNERTGEPCAPNTPIETLCQDAGIQDSPQGARLTLTYEVLIPSGPPSDNFDELFLYPAARILFSPRHRRDTAREYAEMLTSTEIVAEDLLAALNIVKVGLHIWDTETVTQSGIKAAIKSLKRHGLSKVASAARAVYQVLKSRGKPFHVAQGNERLETRLRALPHDARAELEARMKAAPTNAERLANEALAVHVPLPASVTSDVLLSSDLLPFLFRTLEMPDHAAASVCRAWLHAWNQSEEGRRGLRLEQAHDISHLDISNRELEGYRWLTADLESEEFYYYTPLLTPGPLESYDLDGAKVAERQLDEGFHSYGALSRGPQGVLFAIQNRPLNGATNEYDDVVLALDARTLEVRERFRDDLCFEFGASGLACTDEEVVVGDRAHGVLRVFSPAGVYLRDITGGWQEPLQIVHFEGRLYLLDGGMEGADSWKFERDEAAEKRIFVLTPQGETLQVWKTPGGAEIDRMAVRGRRLYLLLRVSESESSHFHSHLPFLIGRECYHIMLALKGI